MPGEQAGSQKHFSNSESNSVQMQPTSAETTKQKMIEEVKEEVSRRSCI